MAESELTPDQPPFPAERPDATPRPRPYIGAVVQARMGSTRLPGKALLPLPLGGATTVFEHVLRRAARAGTVHEVIAALPDTNADMELARLATAAGFGTLRGSEADVLGRFQAAAARFGYDHIVRLTADNPALDPVFIDAAVRAHLAAAADYTLTTGLPLGMNIEVISRTALESAHHAATAPFDREHVTPYLRAHPTEFRLLTLPLAVPAAALRLTLDYPTDYALLSALYSALGPDFGLADVLGVVAHYPWLVTLNAANEQVSA